jgi:hypothetical protein
VPICRALSGQGVQIAPRTYWARRSRPPSRRALKDEALTGILAGIYEPVWQPEDVGAPEAAGHHGRPVHRGAADAGRRVAGVTRARTVRTTIPDPGHSRAPDLVKRHFQAERPRQLRVAEFTSVPLDGGGFGSTALVVDAFAGLIAGWECSLSKETAFVERAVRQAAALRARQGHPLGGGAVHHSDAACMSRVPRRVASTALRGR